MKVILASGNEGKVKEIKALLADLPIELISQKQFGVTDADETGSTFIENALIKARHAANATGFPALADDSGLSIDALGGAPGIFSARYAGEQANDQDRINKVLNEMQDVPDAERTAQFHCAIVLVHPTDEKEPIICEGIWPGTILHAAQGEQGFGYDPIFFVPEHDCSAAELEPDLKNQISHRGRAIKLFKSALAIKL